MSIFEWIVAIYLILGLISSITCLMKEPILFEFGFSLMILFPVMIFLFPYFLWKLVLFNDQTGRWI